MRFLQLWVGWFKEVLQDPDKAVVEVRVDRFHIVQCDRFTQQLFVEGQSEAAIDVVAVKHRHAHDATHEVEVGQVLLHVENRDIVHYFVLLFSFCTMPEPKINIQESKTIALLKTQIKNKINNCCFLNAQEIHPIGRFLLLFEQG